ncbi:MAG: hypothetical protein ACPGVA_03290 [Pikeienuella sp.]
MGDAIIDMLHMNLFREISLRSESLRQLSLELTDGKNGAYLANLRSKKSDLKASTLLLLHVKLGIHPNKILGLSHQLNLKTIGSKDDEEGAASQIPIGIDESIGFDPILESWHAANGLIEDMSPHIRQYIVLYGAPEGQRINPVRVGEKSMAGLTLRAPTAEALNAALDTVAPEVMETHSSHHFAVMQGRKLLTTEAIDVQWPNGVRVALEYDRLLLPVRDKAGATYILNYSKYVGAIKRPSDDIGKIDFT